MSPKRRKMLGEILIERNQLLPEQLEAALEGQKRTEKRLGQVLIDMGFLGHDEVMSAISQQTGIPHVWLQKGLVDPKVVKLLPKDKAQASCVIPMFNVSNTLTLGMADTTDLLTIDDVESMTGCRVQPVQCRRADVEAAIREYYSEGMEMEDFVESFQASDVQVAETPSHYEDLRMVAEQAEGAYIINLVNLFMLNAIKEGASDIHIEPDVRTTRVRYRIDGALQEAMTPRGDLHPAIISRIKVMARMDIAVRRTPQDGRIRVVAEGKDVDLRVSSMPTVLGEKIVIRLLDRSRLELDINRIGFSGEVLQEAKSLLSRPHGIILVTGPTGSGKTTTLYSGLAFISSIERNIVTIEDPVEFQLPLINQVQVNEEQGLTFARTLRSILRQDPDVIMVGEIRDKETAEVAIQAALTGHLVLATLHTNESAGAIARLVDMGIEPFLLTSSVIGVIAQRLVRTVCSNCRTNYLPPRELLERIGWQGKNTTFVTGRGCERCFDSGLRGRSGVFELLAMTDGLRDTILRKASAETIRTACVKSGMRMMKDEAFQLVEEGKTSLEEVLRVVFVEGFADEAVGIAEG
jgi:type IV pilus assembly protein PilB